MKIIEIQDLTIREAIRYAKKQGIPLHYSLLQGLLNKEPIRNNTYLIPGTFMRYLRFNKGMKGKGCRVEKIEVCYSKEEDEQF